MSKLKVMIRDAPHETLSKREFKLTLTKKELSDEHDYWLYIVQAQHAKWRPLGFWVVAIKKSFPSEELADQLAKTLGMEAVKELLETATEQGRDMLFPVLTEGWAVF